MSDQNTDIARELANLRAAMNSIKDEMSGTKPKFTDELHDVLDLLISNNVDGVNHYINQLAEAVRSNPNMSSEELKRQVNTVLPHIQQAFRSLAEDRKASFRNADSGHNQARNELEAQTEQMKLSNFQLSLALQNVKIMADAQNSQIGSDTTEESVALERYLQLHDYSNTQEAEIQKLKAELASAGKPTVAGNPQVEASLKEEIQELKAALAHAKSQKSSTESDSVENLRKTVEELENANRAQEDTIRDQRSQIHEHDEKCRILLARHREMVEQVAEAKGNIRVMVRIRPAGDIPEEDQVRFTNPERNSNLPWSKLRASYLDDSNRPESREFDFQRAFGTGETNEDIFGEVKDFAQSAALGKSCTIMAYGATGTGKSYTFLSGDGLVHNFIRLMFQLASEEAGQFEYEMVLSAVEIYLGNVFDLLQTSANGQKVEIKLTNESTVPLGSEDEAFEIIKQAIDRREAASTKQNETSSRSHFIISITIVRRSKADGKTTQGTTSFVDLAGSESVGKNLPSGSRTPQQELQLKEGTDINRSLLNLGQNIKQIASKGDRFLPDHNLTRFLRPSLSQGSRLLVIVTVSPLVENQSNTLASLRWSMEAVGGKSNRITGSRFLDTPSSSRSGRTPILTPSTGQSAPATPSSQRTRSDTRALRTQTSTRALRNASGASSRATPPEPQSPSIALAERRERRERANAESAGAK